MTDVALAHKEGQLAALPGWRVALIVLVAVAVAFTIAWIVPWGREYPPSAVIPFAEVIILTHEAAFWMGALILVNTCGQ